MLTLTITKPSLDIKDFWATITPADIVALVEYEGLTPLDIKTVTFSSDGLVKTEILDISLAGFETWRAAFHAAFPSITAERDAYHALHGVTITIVETP